MDIFLSCFAKYDKIVFLPDIFSSYLKKTLRIDILYFVSLILLVFHIHFTVDVVTLVIIFTKMFTSVTRFDNF